MLAVALSPNARALIQADRSALLPTAADRRRVEAALRARLGPSVLPVETPLRDLLASVGWQLPSGAALGLCLIGGALFLALRPAEVTVSSPVPSEAPATFVAATPAPVASEDSPAPLPAPTAATLSPTPSTADPLAQEVALLSRAMSQLHSGHATEALVALDQHQLRFPTGALSQERRAMKVQALCRMGRFREGRAELAGLVPGSIAYERIKAACSPEASDNRR